jgi:PIN domain nuclease of toxin-antitoxin system
VILLDTHVWVWWVHDDPRLPAEVRLALDLGTSGGLAVSAISCWEVAKLVEFGRLDLDLDVPGWLELALGPSGVRLVGLDPRISAEACALPGTFHRDPADQLIVATSRLLDFPLATCDEKIRHYPYVRLLGAQRIHDR